MRTKLNITEGIFPMPVLMVATYNEDGSVNVMNAAWGTMQERDTVVAGRRPNNSSLFPPLAAVVVVASHIQRKIDF